MHFPRLKQALPFLSLLCVVTLRGQTSQITGLVTDSTSAAVPGAEVTATHIETGTARKATTNATGSYTLPFLPTGTYRVDISRSGFRPVTRQDISLSLDQVVRVDFALELGAVNEAILVEAKAAPLESETSSLGQVVENKTIVTLPLNGRNYTQLVGLIPGAAPTTRARSSDGMSINGNRVFQNSFLIDGIDNNNYILGVDTDSTQAVHPSVDAIQEFKVDTANFSAEYGRAAGGVINVAIKSGSNEFHGSLFEFFRHDKLDANDFFSNRAGLDSPPLRFNQFGGTLGGPIFRNRTFFFGSYQGTRQRRSDNQTVSVPTREMINGNFGSVNIYDPLNVVNGVRQQFPNNRIPENRIDPVGRRIAQLYAPPNLPGLANNFSANQIEADDRDQYDTRLDHTFSTRDMVFFRYSRSDRGLNVSGLFGPPGNGATGGIATYARNSPSKAWSAMAGHTHVFSSNIVNQLRAGYTSNVSDQNSPADRPLYDEFGIRGVPMTEGLTGLPMFNLTGYANMGDRTFSPNPKRVAVYQITDTLSWVRGSHTIKFGGDFRRTSNFAGTSNNARGNFTFNGQFTSQRPGQGSGDAIADLLLGQTSNAVLSTLLVGDFLSRYGAVFIDDTWKLSPKLTLNLGLRYELQTPLVERENRMANLDLDPASPTYGQFYPAKEGGISNRAFFELDKNNFAPRVGFAYQLHRRTVIRSSGGVFYGGLGYQGIAQGTAANIPNFVSISFPSSNTLAASVLPLAGGFPADALDLSRVRNANGVAVIPHSPITEVYQWNFNVQQDLGWKTVATAGYVGSGSSYLRGLSEANQPVPGPGGINPRRPFPAYGNVTLISSFAHSTYHGLQAKLERRFAKGLSFLSSYTWSHSIDNSVDPEDNGSGPTNPQNPRDTNAEKSSSANDLRHRSVSSVIYELQLNRNGVLGGFPVARTILTGWQVGGIITAQTGRPITPGLAVNPANTGGVGRPDRLRDGNLPSGERTIDRWFDVNAFVLPAPFTFGNSGRFVLRAPSLVNLDLLLARNFNITEDKRVEFRGEFFNATNSVHFAPPNVTIGSPAAGTIRGTAVPNRQIQLGLRLVF
jgi:hypothetical protein